MTRVYNGGTYDLLHAGHVFAFRQMRDWVGTRGEVVIGLNRDAFVERFKGHPTVQSLADRIEVVSSIRYVDRVVENFGDEDSKAVLELIRPDIIAVGHDWWSLDDSRYCQQMGFTPEWLRERQIVLRYMAWMPDRSSTNLRQGARLVHQDGETQTIETHSGPLTVRLASR